MEEEAQEYVNSVHIEEDDPVDKYSLPEQQQQHQQHLQEDLETEIVVDEIPIEEASPSMQNVGQANREASGKKHIQHTNSSESEAKNHHVNALYGLNQLVEEKQMKYIRVSKTLAREGEAIYTQDCVVLQDLAFGQGHLDSEF